MHGHFFAFENVRMRVVKAELITGLTLCLRVQLTGERYDAITVFPQL